MIRLLTEQDRQEAVALLSLAPALNLYMLGNIEALGFEQPFCQFWGDFDEGNGSKSASLKAVLNRYMTGWTIYGKSSAEWAALGQIIDCHPTEAKRLQDNPSGIESLLPFVQRYQIERQSVQTLMTLSAKDFQAVEAPQEVIIRRATMADKDALVSFYGEAEQMTRSAQAIEEPLRRLRIWIALQEKRILSAALTNAEITGQAMIGGVYTKPAARGRGLSQALCSALGNELLLEQKTPVLYWETAASGAVYRKIGFQAVGYWRSIRLAPVNAAE